MASIRVVIADDHRLMLEAIKTALEPADDIEIVGEAMSGSQVLPLIAKTDPDLVVLDVRMPEMDGLACLDRIRQRYPRVRVVMLSAADDRQLIEAALNRGASAFVLKHIDPRDLASALRQACDGSVYRTLGEPPETDGAAAREAGLTAGELRILTALAAGRSNKEIAKELWLSDQTVKFHLRNIYRKLGVANRTEASRFAYQHGLVANPVFDGSEPAAVGV